MAMLDRPGWVGELLRFAAEICESYGRAFVERGLGVILFDSHASPPMTYPEIYRRIILPPTARGHPVFPARPRDIRLFPISWAETRGRFSKRSRDGDEQCPLRLSRDLAFLWSV